MVSLRAFPNREGFFIDLARTETNGELILDAI
jgi:hypothetical protein